MSWWDFALLGIVGIPLAAAIAGAVALNNWLDKHRCPDPCPSCRMEIGSNHDHCQECADERNAIAP